MNDVVVFLCFCLQLYFVFFECLFAFLLWGFLLQSGDEEVHVALGRGSRWSTVVPDYAHPGLVILYPSLLDGG